MSVSMFRKEEWGTWVDIKKKAADLLRKDLERAKNKGKVTILMSSSTDPYQPIEYKEKVTRSLLEVMVENKPDFLFVQTRLFESEWVLALMGHICEVGSVEDGRHQLPLPEPDARCNGKRVS
jgi:DNA repair photolyase